MSYRDNVKALCDEMGISHPIQESDLDVCGAEFLLEDTWEYIHGNKMSNELRLILQKVVPAPLVNASWDFGRYGPREQTKKFFCELWDKADETHDPLVAIIKNAADVRVYRKLSD